MEARRLPFDSTNHNPDSETNGSDTESMDGKTPQVDSKVRRTLNKHVQAEKLFEWRRTEHVQGPIPKPSSKIYWKCVCGPYRPVGVVSKSIFAPDDLADLKTRHF